MEWQESDKKPTPANLFAMWYPYMRKISMDHGYCLTMHGTMMRDFDLVLIPWIEDASAPEVVLAALAAELEAWQQVDGEGELIVSDKPHGRKAYVIYMHSGLYLDISVMPKLTGQELTYRLRKYE